MYFTKLIDTENLFLANTGIYFDTVESKKINTDYLFSNIPGAYISRLNMYKRDFPGYQFVNIDFFSTTIEFMVIPPGGAKKYRVAIKHKEFVNFPGIFSFPPKILDHFDITITTPGVISKKKILRGDITFPELIAQILSEN